MGGFRTGGWGSLLRSGSRDRRGAVLSTGAPDRVLVTCPLRVDCGNALDLAEIATIMQPYRPCTVNIAVDLRVQVQIERCDDQQVVIDDGTRVQSSASVSQLPSEGSAKLVAAILRHFQLSGVRVTVRSPVPRGSGLGGSGAVAVALVAACQAFECRPAHSGSQTDPSSLALLAQSVEAANTSAPVGWQDHLAAAFGGVSLWQWPATDRRRLAFTDPQVAQELSERLVVAVFAETHSDGGLSAAWAESVRNGRLETWIRTADATRAFADAMRSRDWKRARSALNAECELRLDAWPDVMAEPAKQFRDDVLKAGGAARFCGGGAGGAVWCLIEPEARAEFLDSRRGGPRPYQAHLVQPRVDPRGVVVECEPAWT